MVLQGLRFLQRGRAEVSARQGVDAAGQGFESRVGLARLGPAGGSVLVQRGFFAAPAGVGGAPGGELEALCRALGPAAVVPVPGQARRLAAAFLQPGRALRVDAPRHHHRHAAQHGVGHQVVRESPVAQHVGALQFVPGAGQLHRAHADGGLGRFDAEVHAGHRSHARQRERRFAQALQSPFDQGPHAGRPRQFTARQTAVGQALLQGFQNKERVAAGVAYQRLGQSRTLQTRDRQGLDEQGGSTDIQRLELDHCQTLQLAQGVAQVLRGRGCFCGALGKEPTLWGVGRAGQAGDQFGGGGIGKVQVIQHHGARTGLLQQLSHGSGHGAWRQG